MTRLTDEEKQVLLKLERLIHKAMQEASDFIQKHHQEFASDVSGNFIDGVQYQICRMGINLSWHTKKLADGSIADIPCIMSIDFGTPSVKYIELKKHFNEGKPTVSMHKTVDSEIDEELRTDCKEPYQGWSYVIPLKMTKSLAWQPKCTPIPREQ